MENFTTAEATLTENEKAFKLFLNYFSKSFYFSLKPIIFVK